MFTVRWLFYIQGQAPKVLSSAVSSSEKGKTGKGLGKGLARAWLLVANQTCSLGCLSMQDFCLNLTTDKDLLEHKLLVTNCVVTLGKCTWRVVQSLHAVHSVMHKKQQWTFFFFIMLPFVMYCHCILNLSCKDIFSPCLSSCPITTKARVAMV